MASIKVLLNGIPIAITKNLDCALRHLRFRVAKRILWIDAISINQSNTQERYHQVERMGRVHSTARRVIVWLGPVDQHGLHLRAILAAMQFHFWDKNPSTITLFDYICSLVSLMNEHVGKTESPKECVLDALFRIANRPWFQRIWVVQELALSRIAAVHVGAYSFPWQPFEYFFKWLPSHKVDPRTRPHFVNAITRVVKVTYPRHFASQLCRTLHLSASDPRDKVFSILGISHPSGMTISPDYTKTVQMVFLEAMIAMIRDGRLESYYYAPFHPLRESCLKALPGLPSWVPDFRILGAAPASSSEHGIQGHKASLPNNGYNHPMNFLRGSENSVVCPSTEIMLGTITKRVPFPVAKVSQDLTTLFAPGILIGIVAETSGNPLESSCTTTSTLDLPHCVHHFYHTCAKPRGVSAMSLVRILILPKLEAQFDAAEYSAAVSKVFNTDVDQSLLSSTVRKAIVGIRSEVTSSVAGKIIFVTEDGKFGLSYHPDPVNGIRAGDLVVGLLGVNFPFILRANGDGTYCIVNTTGISSHDWGHDFLENIASDLPIGKRSQAQHEPFKATSDGSWEDYKEFGMIEYKIV